MPRMRILLFILAASMLLSCGYDYSFDGSWRFEASAEEFGDCTLRVEEDRPALDVGVADKVELVAYASGDCFNTPFKSLTGRFDRDKGSFRLEQQTAPLGSRLTLNGKLKPDSRQATGGIYRNLDPAAFELNITEETQAPILNSAFSAKRL